MSRQIGGPAGTGSPEQRPQASPAAGYRVAGQRLLNGGVDVAQQDGDVVGIGVEVVQRAREVGVGRADVGELAPRDGEHGARTARNGQDDCDVPVLHQRGGHDHMDPPGRAQGLVAGAQVNGLDVVDPHAGGVHQAPSGHVDRAGAGVDSRADGVTGPVLQHIDQRGVIGHRRPVIGGGADDGEGEAGVVGAGVVVEEGAVDLVGLQAGHEGDDLISLEALVPADDGGAAGEIVGPEHQAEQAGQELRDKATFGIDGDHEPQRRHQERGVAQQPSALGESLVDELDVALLEVADAAMDHLGRFGGSAIGEVAPLHQAGAQAAGGGIQGHARSRRASADDQHVELLGGQPLQRPGPIENSVGHWSLPRLRC